jgi:hypothetical protein
MVGDTGGMFVRVTEGAATVEDAGNLRQLHVELAGVEDAAAGAALGAAGLGVLDGDHAWLDIAALRAAGGGDAEWAGRFEGMVRYAESHGWVAADRVRAHVERR